MIYYFYYFKIYKKKNMNKETQTGLEQFEGE